MKKNAKSIVMTFFLILFAGIFTGCVLLIEAAVEIIVEGIVEGVVEGVEAIADNAKEAAETRRENRAAAEAGRKRTYNEKRTNLVNNGFSNPPEERLARRTSELTGGEPVDVTLYLLNESSFAVMEDAILRCITIIDVDTAPHNIFEFDIAVTYEANRQEYQNSLMAISSEQNERRARSKVERDMKRYAAESLGLRANNIKKLTVIFNNTRKKNLEIRLEIPTIFQDLETPCYYQFDVEVEYRKQIGYNSFWKKSPAEYEIFNKVYRSNFVSLPAAALEVQYLVWEDALAKVPERLEYGIYSLPLPIINFVKAAKYTN